MIIKPRGMKMDVEKTKVMIMPCPSSPLQIRIDKNNWKISIISVIWWCGKWGKMYT
jgi:hypothetical protein